MRIKQLLFFVLLLCAGVAQGASTDTIVFSNSSIWMNNYVPIEVTKSTNGFVVSQGTTTVEICVHEWEQGKYWIAEQGFFNAPSYPTPSWKSVEVCKKCGLIRVNRGKI